MAKHTGIRLKCNEWFNSFWVFHLQHIGMCKNKQHQQYQLKFFYLHRLNLLVFIFTIKFCFIYVICMSYFCYRWISVTKHSFLLMFSHYIIQIFIILLLKISYVSEHMFNVGGYVWRHQWMQAFCSWNSHKERKRY